MRRRRHALSFSAVFLLATSCASGTRPPPAGPPEPDVTLVYAGAAAESPLVPEVLEVPLETRPPGHEPSDPMDGIQARRIFTRAAAARGARFVSDLEFHLAVEDEPHDGHTDFECVVRLQTLPAGVMPPSEPPDAITTLLSRDEPVRLVRPSSGKNCVEMSMDVPAGQPNRGTSMPGAQRTVRDRRCGTDTAPVAVLPYWAADAWFLPVFYDRERPPATGRWQLFVSSAHCAAVPARLPHSFVRGTIYLPPAAPAAAAPTAPR